MDKNRYGSVDANAAEAGFLFEYRRHGENTQLHQSDQALTEFM